MDSEKRKSVNKITLEDSKEKIISDDALVSEDLSSFFFKMPLNGNIIENSCISHSSSSITDGAKMTSKMYPYIKWG